MRKKILSLCVIGLMSNSLYALDCAYMDAYGDDLSKIKAKDAPCVAQIVSEYMSKEVPIQVDKYTKILSVQNTGTSLSYKYKIEGMSNDTVTNGKDRLKQVITASNCSDPQTNWIFNVGVDVTHRYFDSLGTFLFDFVVNKESCQRIKQ